MISVFESGRTARLFQHYKSLCGSRDMPSRAELDPADFKHHLPYVYIAKIVDRGAGDIGFQITLMGTELVYVFKQDFTGKLVRDIDLGGLEGVWRTSLLHAFEHRTPMVALDRVRLSNGTELDLEHLALPLADDHRTIDRMFGCFDFPRLNDDWLKQNAAQIDWSKKARVRVPKRLLISRLDVAPL